MQAEHYERTRQQQVDIGLLAPEEAQQSADQVLASLLLHHALHQPCHMHHSCWLPAYGPFIQLIVLGVFLPQVVAECMGNLYNDLFATKLLSLSPVYAL